MLRRLLPRTTDFFSLFSRHAALAVEAAHAVRALVRDLAELEERAERVRAIEHQADAICQETMERLHRTFVTPIDRGDIHALASRLDDIVDQVESTAQRLWLYEIRSATPEILEMVERLVQAVEGVREAVDALRDRGNGDRTRALCRAIKEVEKENDRLLRRATAKLFHDEQDPKTLIKWKEIYDTVEGAIDTCEDVANVIEGLVLENA